ncbi:MAG TPA: hypothetical protein VEX15_19205 [Nocardioidaceae bacterium]|nr:hypothetical protein [Nocardioidaceae bacterium]
MTDDLAFSGSDAAPAPPSSVPPDPPTPVNFKRPGALVAALAALWLALHEVSNLSGQFLTREGGGHATFNELGGPMAWRFADHRRDVFSETQVADWKQLLIAYLLLDVIFIFLYRYALVKLIDTISGRAPGAPRHWTGRLVWALALVDLAEDAAWFAVGVCARDVGDPVSPVATYGLAALAAIKWLLIGGLALAAVVAAVRSGDLVAARFRAIRSALSIQRFSLLAFLPIAVLAVLPLAGVNNLFDQLPDVQRAWLDNRTGAWHWIAAGLVFGLVVLPTIFILGRLRANWAYRRVIGSGTCWPYYDPPSDGGLPVPRRQGLMFWLAGPVLLIILALLVAFVLDGEVFGLRLGIFCAVPFVIMAVSLLMRGRGYQALEVLPPRDIAYARDVMAVGDVLTVAALSLTGLGLIRAFTGETVLSWIGLLDLDPGGSLVVGGNVVDPWAPPWFPLLVGLAFTILPWLFSFAVLTWLHGLPPHPAVPPWAAAILKPGEGASVVEADDGWLPNLRELLSAGLLAVWIAIFVLLAAFPRWFAYEAFGAGFGALAVATLALGTLTLMLGQIMAYAQGRQPPEFVQLFRVVLRPQWVRHFVTGQAWADDSDTRVFRRFRATPVISLLAITVAATAMFGSRTDVHPVVGSGSIPERPGLEEAFDLWMDQDDASPTQVTQASASDPWSCTPPKAAGSVRRTGPPPHCSGSARPATNVPATAPCSRQVRQVAHWASLSHVSIRIHWTPPRRCPGPRRCQSRPCRWPRAIYWHRPRALGSRLPSCRTVRASELSSIVPDSWRLHGKESRAWRPSTRLSSPRSPTPRITSYRTR